MFKLNLSIIKHSVIKIKKFYFRIFGLCNNFVYVLMLCASKDINNGSNKVVSNCLVSFYYNKLQKL